MSQNPFAGAPNGAIWGFDPTTSLWIPVGISPKLIAANGEEYASLMVSISNANPNGQKTMANSAPVVIASDQVGIPTVLQYGTQFIGYTQMSTANATQVPAATTPTVVGGGAQGAFFGASIITAGTAAMTIYDTSAQFVLAAIPANATVGQYFAVPSTGVHHSGALIVSGAASGAPAIVVFWS